MSSTSSPKRAKVRPPAANREPANVTTVKKPRATPRAAPVPETPAPAPSAPERDYLVIFEEPDPYGLPSDDVLVLDIDGGRHKRPEVDVQQRVKLELTNTTSRLGTVGYVVALVGAALGAVLMVTWSVFYPAQWYGGANSVTTVRTVILLAVAALACMIAGTVLTHYGRRIHARSELSDVRIVEKAPQSRIAFD